VALTLIVGQLGWLTGCATIARGTSQEVTVKTQPTWRPVSFGGQTLYHGDTLKIAKQFHAPRFSVGDPENAQSVPVRYKADPWLLGDVALLFAGVVPGVVALAVDVSTGAWRNYDAEQTVPAGTRWQSTPAQLTGYRMGQ
jgi:hypothetical protein